MRMFLGFLRTGPRARQRCRSATGIRFIRERRARGEASASSGRPVSDRTIEQDLKLLLAILNWAAKSRDEHGRLLLLDSNPLKGLKTPKEKNPTRVVLVRGGIPGASPRCPARSTGGFIVALVLAHETGHRIGAIRQLRWSDIDLRRKSGAVARGAREVGLRTPDAGDHRGDRRSWNAGAKEESLGSPNALVLPAPGNPSTCVRFRAGRAPGGRERRGSRGWSRSTAEAGTR